MADLFDVSVGGVGWHFTSHLVALAALFIACFAIAGYITFRKDSIPGDALKDHDVDVEDIEATTVKTTGDVTVGGKLLEHKSIRQFLPTLDTVSSDAGVFNDIFDMLARNKPSSAADSQILLGHTPVAASAPTTLTVDAATDNVIALNGVTIVNGALTTTLTLNDSATAFAAAGQKSLIYFDSFTMATGVVLTIAGDDTDGHDASAGEQFCSGAGTSILTRQAVLVDTQNNLVLTATGATTILSGSFIYLEATGANTVAIKTCLRTTGGTIAITSAA